VVGKGEGEGGIAKTKNCFEDHGGWEPRLLAKTKKVQRRGVDWGVRSPRAFKKEEERGKGGRHRDEGGGPKKDGLW